MAISSNVPRCWIQKPEDGHIQNSQETHLLPASSETEQMFFHPPIFSSSEKAQPCWHGRPWHPEATGTGKWSPCKGAPAGSTAGHPGTPTLLITPQSCDCSAQSDLHPETYQEWQEPSPSAATQESSLQLCLWQRFNGLLLKGAHISLLSLPPPHRHSIMK